MGLVRRRSVNPRRRKLVCSLGVVKRQLGIAREQLTLLSRKLVHLPWPVRQAEDGVRTWRGWAGPAWELLRGDRRRAEQQDATRVVRVVRDGSAGERGEKERGADRGDDVRGRGDMRTRPS